jgi:hypothetical protein
VPFFARLCRALDLPLVILHDSDIYSGDDLPEWKIKENRQAPTKNESIRNAAGDGVSIRLMEPSLEAVLGISRSADDKPRKVLAAIEQLDDAELPADLTGAVRDIAQLVDITIASREGGTAEGSEQNTEALDSLGRDAS